MLRSKATAALLKLKEIDRKYKIKSSEVVKLQSSMSDISAMDSEDEISKHLTGSGDKPDAIITSTRPKLDIRMPDARMERAAGQENESKLVTIFNKANNHSPNSDPNNYPKIITSDKITEEPNSGLVTGEVNASEMQEQIADTETSISEDVSVFNHLEANLSQEITPKSVDSIIDAEEAVQSGLDEDPSTLVASGTYSDDFVKTVSSENAKESNTSPRLNVVVDKAEILEPELTSSEVKYVTSTPLGYYQRQQSPELDKNAEPETEDIEEVLRVDIDLDADLENHVKKIDANDVESPANLPKQRSSSVRSSKEHRRRRRPNAASSSSRDSKSPEFSSSLRQKRNPEATTTSGTSHPSKTDRHSSGQSSSDTDRSGKEKDLKNSQTVSKVDAIAVIRREKVAPKMKKLKNLKSGTRAKDSSTKEPPPNYSRDGRMQKYKSAIQSVPVTMVGPASNFLQFSKDHQVDYRPAQRASKYRSASRGQKRRSNKHKAEDSLRSRHRTKGGIKTHSEEEPGLGYQARDVDRLRQQIKELRLQQERDQLRSRIRGYVQQMMNEQQRLLAHDGQFGGSIDQFDHSATGLRQTEALRSFFKPLDLPNVAAFKRPDFEEYQAADLDNERHLQLKMIRERVLGIRHWLKQQFVLYRDYSNLVSTINAKYIPVTLKETKKMIHDMQRFYNTREKRRHVR